MRPSWGHAGVQNRLGRQDELSNRSVFYTVSGRGDNYGPIALLTVAYKIITAMLKSCLLDAEVDSKFGSSQFGFRKGYGSSMPYLLRDEGSNSHAQNDTDAYPNLPSTGRRLSTASMSNALFY